MHRPSSIAVAAVTLIGLAGTGSLSSASSSATTAPVGQARPATDASPTVTIGSANFTENEVLANIYADALQRDGPESSRSST